MWRIPRLLAEIDSILDETFNYIWVEGEISNLKIASSGHIYFTLKDSDVQIKAVIFRSQAASIPFVVEDGQHIICLARLNVYPARGDLQLVVEAVEKKGEGALMLALEAIKVRLAEKGLFAEEHKRPLPVVPDRVFAITSPTGAAIHDFIRTARGRLPGARIILCPARVQGEGAEGEIIAAMKTVSRLAGDGDVILLTRGGGSIEDLWAFNSEELAWQIFNSPVPVVSAVGHEVDFTISDLVADYRAATPTAAAQAIFPSRNELLKRLNGLMDGLAHFTGHRLEIASKRLQILTYRMKDPKKRLAEWRIRLDAVLARCAKAVNLQMERRKAALSGLAGRLEAVSPLAILSRGYSIVYTGDKKRLIRDSDSVKRGDRLIIIPQKGAILCEVLSSHEDIDTLQNN
ncbi:MAG: exodeoxyribonuclease VII large subunit [Desulfobacteraceae bacterium]|nr:exodeoxyribonuclease VII large subunit [Desulfobacteraceae bacterium]